MDALFELATGGVQVVIATHSSDIMERLLALATKHLDSQPLIALNHFSKDGVINSGLDFRPKIGAIIQDLTDSFSNSYMMSKGL